MFHFSPRDIEALKCGFKHISKNEEVFASIRSKKYGYEIGYFPISEIEPHIPKSYRDPGYILYEIFDKEYLTYGPSHNYVADWEEWANRMTNSDVLVRINKAPEVHFVFPLSCLPVRYHNAIRLRCSGVPLSEMYSKFPNLSPTGAANLVGFILNGDKGYDAETEYLMKAIGL